MDIDAIQRKLFLQAQLIMKNGFSG